MSNNFKETIRQIGESIQSHVEKEHKEDISNRAFARATCTLSSESISPHVETVWITNREDYQGYKEKRDFTGTGIIIQLGRKTALQDSDGKSVYKNSKLGEALTKFLSGTQTYTSPGGEQTLEIHNRSEYKNNGLDPIEVEIRLAGEKDPFRFQRLSLLLDAVKVEDERIKKQQEELKRIEEEKEGIARELEEKYAREEQERLEAEQRKKDAEAKKVLEDIERHEKIRDGKLNQIKAVRSFMRKNVLLRSQHLLDQYQEDAKRSHIYDGVPIVIDGGPGTGKTTTMIQRLMFLLSYQALTEYESKLSIKQIETLTDPETLDDHWLFFSPTEMLLQYLRDNMREEGLRANDRNTRTIAKFRKKVMHDYKLFNPAKEGPFKNYSISKGEEILILDAKKAIKDFERYIIDYWNKTLTQRSEMKTSEYIWHKDAVSIKSRCQNSGKVKDLDGLMNLFNSLQDNERRKVKVWSEELNDKLKSSAVKLKNVILREEEAVDKLKALFERWRKERLGTDDSDDEDAIVDDEDEEEVSFSSQEFEDQLYQELQKLIKRLGLKKYDSKIKFSKRNREIYEIIDLLVDEEEIEIEHIGSVAVFVRNFDSLCRGIESNIIGKIHSLYKSFRKTQIEGNLYQEHLLKKIMAKDSNKHLHPDEQNLVLGFINELFHRIYKRSKIRFDGLKNKYAQAFRESVRNVIGIDEASDYNLLEYYFMISFRHYEFSSITLCGDLMQGLNNNGISDWSEIKNFNLPNLEEKQLNISYRQLPTLLDMARELYHDEIGVYPSYKSEMERDPKEPKPLMLISDDEYEKAEWISRRIIEIYKAYDESLPSVAIFVGDDVNIEEFIERIKEIDLLSEIDVVDCSGNRTLQNKEMVRVFRLSEVKGMEFEVAFFYDIDNAITSHSEKLMRRYLYVGISRATSHLAATMSTTNNSEIIKYFDTNSEGWDI